MAPGTEGFRYIGKKRRTKEDPRFVMGRGRFAADIALPGMEHVALAASPHASARLVNIDTAAALALPGVHYVLTGEEFCKAGETLQIGVDAPKVTRYALARGLCVTPANGWPPWSPIAIRSEPENVLLSSNTFSSSVTAF